MLALKPAPVLITAIGFPLSTGIDTVDYRLVDSITDPPSSERFSTETLLRLDPCFLTYAPLAQAPALSPPPSASAPGITFGSFAALQKVTEQTISLWAGVLRAVPSSQLLYRSHATRSPLARDDLRARFARAGIAPERLMIEPPAIDAAALLPEYRRIDIALDSFPYHGTTTTCEATWMGVPTITLEGSASVSRVGCSILSAVGAPELIARSPDHYAAIASSLAADASRLALLRSDTPAGLRRMMHASPLCDAPAQLRRWHALVREAWTRWCSSPPVPNVCNNPA